MISPKYIAAAVAKTANADDQEALARIEAMAVVVSERRRCGHRGVVIGARVFDNPRYRRNRVSVL
jgi:hypothetical protein